MLSGKQIPIDEIIERAYRETGRDTIDWNDAVVWIGDCLDLIGIPDQYTQKVTDGKEGRPEPLEVKDYRAPLPADFIEVVALREYDRKIPINKSFGAFTLNTEDGRTFTNDFYNTTNQTDYSYQIHGDCIVTTFDDCKLELAYKAFPTDNRGLPLIPDNTKYKLAIQNYVCSKIALQNWVKDPNNTGKKAVYNEFSREADWYIAGAQTAALRPDLPTMEGLKNNWLRSIPKNDQFETGYKFMGREERRRIV